MSREELLDKICLTDATADCAMGNGTCEKCHEVMNNLLDEYDKGIHKKVLIDFVNECVEAGLSDIPFPERLLREVAERNLARNKITHDCNLCEYHKNDSCIMNECLYDE